MTSMETFSSDEYRTVDPDEEVVKTSETIKHDNNDYSNVANIGVKRKHFSLLCMLFL